ncbi:MAG TPA: hypothetical protein VN805_14545 [Caulobacteraceae bacterium]|nr:hypothetical protein [Caulobacteraceae bacterium]
MALPPISGQPAPRLQAASDARAAAQRAFFEAALGRAPAQLPAAPPAKVGPAIAANRATAAATVEAPQPAASARPGSLVNIVV